MMGYHLGYPGDKLNVNAFEGADCTGDKTTVVNGYMHVQDFVRRTTYDYNSFPEDTNMCSFDSMSLTNQFGR